MVTKIHETASVDVSAELGDGVIVGPHAVVESGATIGDGCELMAGAVVRRYTTLGRGNVVHPFCVLGGEPQDYKFDPNGKTYLRIGSDNIFREHVTISRATKPGGETVIGDGCFFMTGSHIGHDCVIGNGVVLTNGASVAGHCEIADRAILSAFVVVHQFCRVGELIMTQALTGISQHIPPFVMLRGINYVVGLNNVGLRRADYITEDDHKQIKEAYRLLYRSSLTPQKALAEMDLRSDWGAAAGRFRDFVRQALEAQPPYNRGLPTARAAQRTDGHPMA
ncbi:MAG: acyl-ACP--UDP-N-acetylglucosamine O-acyltransferase [Planctomycetota bacterium]|nr:acyl-ACP--UDP-N-acetylglucosamine O-acyltransferase [Planctomycetota bacterium]